MVSISWSVSVSSERHLRAGLRVQDAAIYTARGAVARNDVGAHHSRHGAAAPIESKAVLLLLRAVAFVTMLLEQRLDVAREVDCGERGLRKQNRQAGECDAVRHSMGLSETVGECQSVAVHRLTNQLRLQKKEGGPGSTLERRRRAQVTEYCRSRWRRCNASIRCCRRRRSCRWHRARCCSSALRTGGSAPFTMM